MLRLYGGVSCLLQNTSAVLVRGFASQRVIKIRFGAITSNQPHQTVLFAKNNNPSIKPSCAKAVHILWSQLGKITHLTTDTRFMGFGHVHKARVYAQQFTQFVRNAVHKMYSDFTPVIFMFIPIVHSTYNKQSQIREGKDL